MTTTQETILANQEELVAKLTELGVYVNGNLTTALTPKADELLLLYTDAGQKTLEAVDNLLSGLF